MLLHAKSERIKDQIPYFAPVTIMGGMGECLSQRLGQSSMLIINVLDFRCVVPFRNQSAS